jgi:hypothetical protein
VNNAIMYAAIHGLCGPFKGFGFRVTGPSVRISTFSDRNSDQTYLPIFDASDSNGVIKS